MQNKPRNKAYEERMAAMCILAMLFILAVALVHSFLAGGR